VHHPRLGQHRPDGILPLQRPHGGAHLAALIEQLQDAVPGDEAGPAGDEDALLGHAATIRPSPRPSQSPHQPGDWQDP
jgi:hypothetical protein